MKNILIAPSLLAANFANLEHEILAIASCQPDWLHYDVMDGHFVPNLSFGAGVLKATHNLHSMVNDVHLMIENPDEFVDQFIESGADVITFHLEAIKDHEKRLALIQKMKNKGIKVGISIKPKTPVDNLFPYVGLLDLVLIMTVEPGFGGQAFIPSCLTKIKHMSSYIQAHHLQTLIEVDGGINNLTAAQCIEAGANVIVAGSYLFGQSDMCSRLRLLRHG